MKAISMSVKARPRGPKSTIPQRLTTNHSEGDRKVALLI
jgi:hypothetical protein